MAPRHTDDARRACSFCGAATGCADNIGLAGPDGAEICGACVLHFHAIFGAAPRLPSEPMTDAELLCSLPLIAASAAQVSDLLVQCVWQARSRSLSWTAIGTALGVSRQAAWERFARRVEYLAGDPRC
jgi:hypothetical protein